MSDNAEAAARRARAELQELAEEGCSSEEHNHHPDECPGGNGCDNCQCDQHIASRACMVIDALRTRLAAAEEALREVRWLLTRASPKGTLKRAVYENWLARRAAFMGPAEPPGKGAGALTPPADLPPGETR